MVLVVASRIGHSESISLEADDRLSSFLQELREMGGSRALKDLAPDEWDTAYIFPEEPIS